jgi:5-methylcytosine-specific restriction endonuclease McrA
MAWNKANLERRRQISAASARRAYHADIDATRARKRAWRAENADRENTRTQRWRDANPGAVRAQNVRYYHANPDASRARWLTHYLADPEPTRQRNRRRQALVRGATVYPFTVADWQAQVDGFNRRCAYCLRPLIRVTMDHMTPVSRGGDHAIENLVPCCQSCNSRKKDRTLLEYLPLLG